MAFVYVGGRRCLNFVGTMKHRDSTPEELLTQPELLSDWAVQAGLLDAAIGVTVDDLNAAIDVREAVYRTVIARLDGRRPAVVAGQNYSMVILLFAPSVVLLGMVSPWVIRLRVEDVAGSGRAAGVVYAISTAG